MDTLDAIGMSSGDGIPISYVEVEAWERHSGITLTLWEFEAMKKLSSSYLSSVNEYSDEKAQRPYITESGQATLMQEDADRTRAHMRSIQATRQRANG